MTTDTLRKPLFWIAFLLLIIAFLIEIGSGALVNKFPAQVPDPVAQTVGDLDIPELTDALEDNEDDVDAIEEDDLPGYGILFMGFLDAALVLTLTWTALGLVIPQGIQANVQGVASCLISLMMIFGIIFAFFTLLAILIVMIALFLAVPFGTLAYLALYGFFARGAAGGILGILMLLKIGFAVLLILSQQAWLKRTTLMLMIASTIVMTFLVGFLHGLVPIFLVSITDAVGGLIALVCACIWWIPLLISAIFGIIKLIQLSRRVTG